MPTQFIFYAFAVYLRSFKDRLNQIALEKLTITINNNLSDFWMWHLKSKLIDFVLFPDVQAYV